MRESSYRIKDSLYQREASYGSIDVSECGTMREVLQAGLDQSTVFLERIESDFPGLLSQMRGAQNRGQRKFFTLYAVKNRSTKIKLERRIAYLSRMLDDPAAALMDVFRDSASKEDATASAAEAIREHMDTPLARPDIAPHIFGEIDAMSALENKLVKAQKLSGSNVPEILEKGIVTANRLANGSGLRPAGANRAEIELTEATHQFRGRMEWIMRKFTASTGIPEDWMRPALGMRVTTDPGLRAADLISRLAFAPQPEPRAKSLRAAEISTPAI